MNSKEKHKNSQKRRFSRWKKEGKRRHIIVALVIGVIIVAGGLIGYGYYDTNVKPWHQTVVKVNGKTFDMSYFVKMLRLYGVEEDYVYSYSSYIVQIIEENELVMQKAEELGIKATDEEIDKKTESLFGYDPDSGEDDDEFNQNIEEYLDGIDISRSDFEELAVLPIILREKVQEAMGDEAYPEDSLYDHVKVKAVLAGTREDALEIIDKWDEDFNQIIKDYSLTVYYPGEGYWLVMVYEPDEEEEEEEEEGLYIKAILLATEEKAEEVAAEFDGDNFAELAETYSLDSSAEDGGDMGWMSLDDIELKFGDLDTIETLKLNTLSDPISGNYPDEAVEWLPAGIESSTPFEEYAFDDNSVGNGVSEPISDTTHITTGGYWLVMVYEPEEEEEQEEEGLNIQAILLDSKEEAEELKADIEAGNNFAEVAEEHSLDSYASSGGDMGWLSLEDIESKFGEENLAAIQALEPNTLSDPLYDENASKQSGYWVIEVLDREDRTLIEDHRDTYISEYYSEWLEGAMETGVKSYLDDEKISWATNHV